MARSAATVLPRGPRGLAGLGAILALVLCGVLGGGTGCGSDSPEPGAGGPGGPAREVAPGAGGARPPLPPRPPDPEHDPLLDPLAGAISDSVRAREAAGEGAGSEEAVIPGRWRLSRRQDVPADESELTPEQRAKLEALRSVGYVGGSKQARTSDVITVHDPDRVAPGVNFWVSGHAPIAFLMTLDGFVLHQWTQDFATIWPDIEISPENVNTDFWRRARLLENGDILAIFEGQGIVKLDKDSNILWANHNQAHHDLDVTPEGEIYVLTRDAHLVPRLHETEPVLEDYVSVLGPDGRERRRVSLLECFEHSGFDGIRQATKRFQGDIFHTNTLRVLDGRHADRWPWAARGNVLTSMRYLDAIAVVDVERATVVQAWQGPFARQHDPRLLDDGNILLFDNIGLGHHSRVLELEPSDLDPDSLVVRWEYRGSEEYPLYSYLCGVARRLGNGNTLIVESDHGRALEVTPDGEVVWEFYNPFRVGESPEYIASLFDLERIPEDVPLDWTHARR